MRGTLGVAFAGGVFVQVMLLPLTAPDLSPAEDLAWDDLRLSALAVLTLGLVFLLARLAGEPDSEMSPGLR